MFSQFIRFHASFRFKGIHTSRNKRKFLQRWRKKCWFFLSVVPRFQCIIPTVIFFSCKSSSKDICSIDFQTVGRREEKGGRETHQLVALACTPTEAKNPTLQWSSAHNLTVHSAIRWQKRGFSVTYLWGPAGNIWEIS